jgi:hypothetical protein
MQAKTFTCCAVVRINGVLCHERGCPDNWKGLTRRCACGDTFKPSNRFQRECEDCAAFYEDTDIAFDADYMELGLPESEGGGF